MGKNAAKTVLVVEKHANHTQLIVKQLLFAKLNPLVAITGEGGLRKVIERRPDLILLELDLSDMDGLEFVAAVRQRPEADRIPIIAMSGLSYMKRPCLMAGCNAFLQKPVKMIELMAHIRRLLSLVKEPPKLQKQVIF
jgi:CheY-like chemotaxis protein